MTTDIVIRKNYLSPQQQIDIVNGVRSIKPGFYIPKTKWDQPMKIQMNCLGNHWNAKTYKYSKTRDDIDGQQCAAIPDWLNAMGQQSLRDTAYYENETSIKPFDICIVNFYPEGTGRLGDHQDSSETKEALASGYPVVSFSIGANGIFRIGGLERTGDYNEHELGSGDLVIFGRSKRLAFHGIKKIIEGTTPKELGFATPGRINLTFRKL